MLGAFQTSLRYRKTLTQNQKTNVDQANKGHNPTKLAEKE